MRKIFNTKTIVTALLVVSTLGVAACGSNKAESVNTGNAQSTEVVAEVATEATEVVAEVAESTEAATEEAAPAVKDNVKGMYWSTTSGLEVAAGESNAHNYIKVNLKDEEAFHDDDITFVSSNPEVVTVEFDKTVAYYYLYFTLTGVSEGEAEIYAVAKDGSIESEHKKVTVTPAAENIVAKN